MALSKTTVATPERKRTKKAPTKARRGNTVKPSWPARFLAELADTANVTHSAKVAGIDRGTAYELRKVDPQFAAAWDNAIEQSTDAMEAEARRRGLDKSDLLLIFMLKANRPDKFRERQESQHTGEVTIRVIREDRPIDRPAE
jgi:hypothetical protein